MFASHVWLAYHVGLRMVWFPDINHQEANIDSGMMAASGLEQVDAKVLFLSRFNHGPWRGGRWLGVQREAAQALVCRNSRLTIIIFIVVIIAFMCVACSHACALRLQAFIEAVRVEEPVAMAMFETYLPLICKDLGLHGSDTPQAVEQVQLGPQCLIYVFFWLLNVFD
jgi:hypothetical protein